MIMREKRKTMKDVKNIENKLVDSKIVVIPEIVIVPEVIKPVLTANVKPVRVSYYHKDTKNHFDMVRKCKGDTFIGIERALIRFATVTASNTDVRLEQVNAILYIGTTSDYQVIGKFSVTFENGQVVKITAAKKVTNELQNSGFVVGSTKNFINADKANF